MTLLDRQKEFTNYLKSGFPELGLKPISFIGAVSITGNGSVENNMLPVTKGRKDHGSDAVLQWRLDRLDGPTGLKGWAEENDLDWATLKTQAAFTLWELNQSRYRTLLKNLREGARTGEDVNAAINRLTDEFCREFERPNLAVANIPLRQRHARSVYKIMSESEPSAATQASAATTVIVGTGLALANSSWSTLALAVFIAAIIWAMGAKSEATVEIEDDDLEPIIPLEITASETAEFDAADAHVKTLEKELEEAKAVREAAMLRVRERAQALLAVVSSGAVAPKEGRRL